MNILIFGCAGFIGINLTKYFLKKKHNVIGVDNLTYASNNKEIYKLKENKNFKFYKLNINSKDILKVIQINQPTWIINMAAESHVDNSIVKPTKFIKGNRDTPKDLEYLFNQKYDVVIDLSGHTYNHVDFIIRKHSSKIWFVF